MSYRFLGLAIEEGAGLGHFYVVELLDGVDFCLFCVSESFHFRSQRGVLVRHLVVALDDVAEAAVEPC